MRHKKQRPRPGGRHERSEKATQGKPRDKRSKVPLSLLARLYGGDDERG